jgi:hypothetical protein
MFALNLPAALWPAGGSEYMSVHPRGGLDRRFDVHRTRFGVPKHIGHPFLNDAIDDLGENGMPGEPMPFLQSFYRGRRRKPMADLSAANLAFERAWSVYLLINNDVDENDERRTTLERFIRKNCEAGENDPETLTVGGLTYLKKLDEIERYSFR